MPFHEFQCVPNGRANAACQVRMCHKFFDVDSKMTIDLRRRLLYNFNSKKFLLLLYMCIYLDTLKKY